MTPEQIVKENEKRKTQLKRPYDPVTGEGCDGERIRLHVPDAPIQDMFLPREMVENEEACFQLAMHGSIDNLFAASGDSSGEQGKAEFWQCFSETRFRYDFEYFAYIAVTILAKRLRREIPFKLNRGQRLLLSRMERQRKAGRPIRIQLLKARQWGGSTLIQMYMLWIQIIHKRNWNSVICAHVKEAAFTIRAMFELAVKNMLPIEGRKLTLRSYQGTANIKEVPERGCLITVGTAESPDSVRSQNIQMAHFSEVALYPHTDGNNPALLESSITGSINPDPFTVIIRESTAQGVGDYFHEEWGKANAGETAYEPVFVPWHLIDELNSRPLDGAYTLVNGKPADGTPEDFAASLTDYELNLFNNHPEITLENLNWRRLKRAEFSSESIMRQEFPADEIEAFRDSGTPVFRADDVEAMRATCKPPIAVGALASDLPPSAYKTHTRERKKILSGLTFIDEPETREKAQNAATPAQRENILKNKLCIWAFPEQEPAVKHRYLTVFDTQVGLSEGADWGVILVIDRYWMLYGGKPEVVAQWRGRLDKDLSVWIAVQIAAFYNNSLFVAESNSFESDAGHYESGEFIFDIVADCYKNVYSRTPADKIMENIPVSYGFHTGRSSKQMIVDNFISVLREKEYVERDHLALNEARTYEEKKNGAYGAKPKKHDDILMTRMIGLHICYNRDEMPWPALAKKEIAGKTVV